MSVIPPKPEGWAIRPGSLLLSRVAKTIGSDADRTAGNTQGQLTQLEVGSAEHQAWIDILDELSGMFDISNWGVDPPCGLERPFQLLASAYFAQMENAVTGDGKTPMIWEQWIRTAEMLLDQYKLCDGEKGRRWLTGSDGMPIRPSQKRTGTVKIVVSGATDVTIFPGTDTEGAEGYGDYVGGSLQEIQRLHGRRSQTGYD